tara:strand:+ start:654 stop:1304 length:651 start_codon:yes stop_codon:yes gene_type:complete
MTSVNKLIHEEIDRDIIVRRALERGIVSQRNLALFLIKKLKLNVSVDAAISAVRRYKSENELEKSYSLSRKKIAKSESVQMTSNIIEISLEKNKQTQDLLKKAFDLVDYDKGEILLVIQGETIIKLIINQKNYDKIITLFSKKVINKIEKNLAKINIHLVEEAMKVPGILSVFSTELMIYGINIVESMSCLPEMLFIVEERDLLKSYECVYKLCNP